MEWIMATRRGFLRIMGGGVILAATGVGAWVATRDPANARAPWAAAGQEADPARRALSYAILAPNPHNRQPWLVDLSVPDQITLYCDPGRKLDHTDPFDRQITVGLGGFLELLVMALAEQGIAAEVALFPQGEPQPRLDGRPVAQVRLTADASVPRDSLFAQVLERRTNREPHDTARPVEIAVLGRIAAAARGSSVAFESDPARVAVLRDLGWRSMQLEMTTPATMKESLDLTRIGRAEIEANPDGISLAGPMLEGLALAGLLSREGMMDTTSSAFRQQMDVLKTGFDTAMAFLWVTTPGNNRADQIRAGRDYVRLNLAATAEGVAMQPWSQALQEFPEMVPLFDEMRRTLAIAPGQGLQMFARLGYADAPRPSPRWPLETRILAT
jgi:hypothetical protein